MPEFKKVSVLPAPFDQLKEELLSMSGVDYELGPILKMSAPPEWRDLHFKDWQEGTELFTSVITLFGVIPFDWHKFRFKSLHCDGFHEYSSNVMNRVWEHRRLIENGPDSVTVTDHVSYESKLKFLGYLMLPIYKAVFAYRHRRLRQRYHADKISVN